RSLSLPRRRPPPAHLIHQPGQKRLPLLPGRLPGPRERSGLLGRLPPAAPLRSRLALGRRVPPVPEQRRGTRKRRLQRPLTGAYKNRRNHGRRPLTFIGTSLLPPGAEEPYRGAARSAIAGQKLLKCCSSPES